MTYIKLGYIFDNREIAETWKFEIRKVPVYPEDLALVQFPPTAISRTSLSDIHKNSFYVSLYAEFIVLNIYLIHPYT